MKHIRLYSDKQLVAMMRVIDPFQWSLWVEFVNISQLEEV